MGTMSSKRLKHLQAVKHPRAALSTHCKGRTSSDERCDMPTVGRRVFCDQCAERMADLFPFSKLD